jgi:hypothetical protein
MAVKCKDLLGSFEELLGVLKKIESKRDTFRKYNKGCLKKATLRLFSSSHQKIYLK